MSECIFCKIANKESATKIFYEDDDVIVIQDIKPIAKQHYLIITKKHFDNLNDIIQNSPDILCRITLNIKKIANSIGMQDYTLTTNNGKNAGQMVMHLHFHLTCN